MIDWCKIEDMPPELKDGRWLRARNADGAEATIQYRYPFADVPALADQGSWCMGVPESDGNWERHDLFYPTHYAEITPPEGE